MIMNQLLRVIFLLICFICTCHLVCGQTINYSHSYPPHTETNDFVTTPDGGYLLAGIRWDNFKPYIFLDKLDADGVQQWEGIIFPDTSTLYPAQSVSSIKSTPDGNYILSVDLRSDIPTIGRNFGLIKVTPLGQVIWNKTIPANDFAIEYFVGEYSVENLNTTADSGYVLATNINHIDYSFYDFQRGLVMRTNAEGDTLWTKQLPTDVGNGLDLKYDFSDLEELPMPLIIGYDPLGFSNYQTDTINSIEEIDDWLNNIESQGGSWTNEWVYHPSDSTMTGGKPGMILIDELFLFKSDSTGVAPLLGAYYASAANTVRLDIFDAIETSSGDFIVVGKKNWRAYVAKLNAQGELVWENTYTFSPYENEAMSIVETHDGNFAIGGTRWVLSNERGLIFKIDPDGNVIWDMQVSGFSHVIKKITETSDHGIIATGETSDFFTVKVSPDGNELWKIIHEDNSYNTLNAFKIFNDTSFFFAGRQIVINNSAGTNYTTSIFRSYDTLGHTLSNTIEGNVFFDQNSDCIFSNNEDTLNQWLIQIEGNNQTTFATSDANGYYSTLVDTGTYMVSLIPLNNYWTACPPQVVQFNDFFVKDTIDLGADVLIECPLLEVDISTPFVRRCFDNTYTVNYCNDGTALAEDAFVEVTMDDYFSYVSSSIPLTNQTGQVLTFDIGNVGIGECGSFNLKVYVDCDSTILGQTHCIEAHIFPDSICDPNLITYPEIEVNGVCQGDSSILFTLENVGTAPMTNTSDYIVIEDHVMYFSTPPNFQLGINQTHTFNIPTDGSTYRIQTRQFPESVYQGNVSLAIEGCGTNQAGGFSTGLVNMFSDQDEEPFTSIDCQESIGSYDPNDKQSFPKGYQAEHFIEKNTEIEYKIRFQNTGTDTAFYVEIIDTLSSFLDPSSILPGASSHPYTWKLYDENLLKFRFENIMLPDSFINEPASNGFVKFKIQQQPDLPNGTIIENNANIYFDFNAPVLTNTTFLTIGENFIEIKNSVSTPAFPQLKVKVFPNPFPTTTNFTLENADFSNGILKIYDNQGMLVKEERFSKNSFELNASDFPKGIFFYLIHLDGIPANSGKIIIQ